MGGRDGRHLASVPAGHRQTNRRPAAATHEQQLEALRQLEEEVDRFTESGEAFRSTVTSLVRREYLQQRRERDRWYGEQLETEERAFNEAREHSIRVFEDFIRRYPNHSKYTPDAMFRLGELYFERSAVDFQKLYDDAQAAREAGDLTAEDSLPTSPDFTPTVDLYKTLARVSRYERSDGVYYLIGYTLNEMGRPEEAVAAWLALVCANKYRYDPIGAPPPRTRRWRASQVPCADPGRAAAGRSGRRRLRQPVRKLPADHAASALRERDLVPDRRVSLRRFRRPERTRPLDRGVRPHPREPQRPKLQSRALQGRLGVLPRQPIPGGDPALREVWCNGRTTRE